MSSRARQPPTTQPATRRREGTDRLHEQRQQKRRDNEGHPSSALDDIQSGLGWVHNTFLLEGMEKTVLRGPLTVSPKPVWFFDNKMAHQVGRKLVSMEASPSFFKLPGIVLSALRG